MRVELKNGKCQLAMIKNDAAILQQAKYLLNFIARNLEDGDALRQESIVAAMTLQDLCVRFGDKYLDDAGNLIPSPAEARVDSSVPA